MGQQLQEICDADAAAVEVAAPGAAPLREQVEEVVDAHVAVGHGLAVPRAGCPLELLGTHVNDGWVAVAAVNRAGVIDEAWITVEVGGDVG